MGNFQGQQAERAHLYDPPAAGREETDVFITTGFTGKKLPPVSIKYSTADVN